MVTPLICRVINPNRLFEDLAVSASGKPKRLERLEWHGGRMPADQKERIRSQDLEQEGPNAEVAIHDPELTGS